MGLQHSLLKLGESPNGILGKISGRIMNLCHRSIYCWSIDKMKEKQYERILDVGCGGGQALKTICDKVDVCAVYGIDHSKTMIELARKTNRHSSKNNRVHFEQASVHSMSFPENFFDVVTTFETIQFWPSIMSGLEEIRRVLKPQGQLMIVNRIPEIESSWTNGLQLKTIDEYKEALYKAGFRQITWDTKTRKGWILFFAEK